MDIDLYDIIRDVLPDHSKEPVSSTFVSSEAATALAENDDPLIYTEPVDFPVTSCTEQQDQGDLQSISEASDETVDYDDITNTCPVYQNAGPAYADSKPTAEPWSSRLDILY